MNYLQLHDNGKLGVDELKLARYFGEGNYTTFYKKHLLQNRIKLTKDDFILLWLKPDKILKYFAE